MARHTPSRPVVVEELFPELIPLRRSAIRLHPRSGNPTIRDSSVGGPLLWPAEEPWPMCAEEHYDLTTQAEGFHLHDAVVPLVPVVQVYQADAPDMPFPQGCDLLQVLWCPFAHGEFLYPLPRVQWRDSRAVDRVAATSVTSARAPEGCVPSPCVVHPERVTDYPSKDLPDDVRAALADRFTRLETDTGWIYEFHLAEAPGIKLGGYPSWDQEPVWPDCDSCGRRMQHLLTVASWEYDGESWRTWLPLEDRAADDTQEPWRFEQGRAAQDAAGLMLGDAGGVYIFECPSCPGRPIGHWFDCS